MGQAVRILVMCAPKDELHQRSAACICMYMSTLVRTWYIPVYTGIYWYDLITPEILLSRYAPDYQHTRVCIVFILVHRHGDTGVYQVELIDAAIDNANAGSLYHLDQQENADKPLKGPFLTYPWTITCIVFTSCHIFNLWARKRLTQQELWHCSLVQKDTMGYWKKATEKDSLFPEALNPCHFDYCYYHYFTIFLIICTIIIIISNLVVPHYQRALSKGQGLVLCLQPQLDRPSWCMQAITWKHAGQYDIINCLWNFGLFVLPHTVCNIQFNTNLKTMNII